MLLFVGPEIPYILTSVYR